MFYAIGQIVDIEFNLYIACMPFLCSIALMVTFDTCFDHHISFYILIASMGRAMSAQITMHLLIKHVLVHGQVSFQSESQLTRDYIICGKIR
jgi:hypothetical protein